MKQTGRCSPPFETPSLTCLSIEFTARQINPGLMISLLVFAITNFGKEVTSRNSVHKTVSTFLGSSMFKGIQVRSQVAT